MKASFNRPSTLSILSQPQCSTVYAVTSSLISTTSTPQPSKNILHVDLLPRTTHVLRRVLLLMLLQITRHRRIVLQSLYRTRLRPGSIWIAGALRRVHGREQALQVVGVEVRDEVLQVWWDALLRWLLRRVVGRVGGWWGLLRLGVRWLQGAVRRCRSIVACISLLLRRVTRTVALLRRGSSGICALRSDHELHCDVRVESVVLFERDVTSSFAAIEDLQADLCRVLVLTGKLHDSHDAFHDLPTYDRLLRESRREQKHVSA